MTVPTPEQEMARQSEILQSNSFYIDKVGIISVKTYKAKGNGVDDDTKYVQDAVNAAVSIGCKQVYLPTGTYNVTGTLTNVDKIAFVGDNAKFVGNKYPVTDMLSPMSENILNARVPPAPFAPVVDGAANNADVLNALLKQGRPVRLPGKVNVKSPVIIDIDGAWVLGDSTNWATDVANASTIYADDDFVGEAVVIIKHSTNSKIRSIGLRDICIDGGNSSVAHGIEGYNTYDGVIFENVTVQGIADNKNCWRFVTALPYSGVNQTNTFINCIGRHRTNNATAETFYGQTMQECVFMNCKMWAGSDSTLLSTATCYKFRDCSGITIIEPSAVMTMGIGFDLEFARLGNNITIISPTIESVKTPWKVTGNGQKLFGTITTVPSLGDTVTQGSVSGIVNFASGTGIYVEKVTGGQFTTGAIYKGGTQIGTITSTYTRMYQNVKISNPRIIGDVGSNKIISIDFCQDSEFDIGSPAEYTTMPYDISVGSNTINTVINLKNPCAITDSGTNTKINIAGYPKVVKASVISGVYYLPNAYPGMEITIAYDVSGGSYQQVYAKTGETISKAATGKYLRVWGENSTLTLQCNTSGKWDIKSFRGIYELEGVGFTNNNKDVYIISSGSVGGQTVGATYSNNGASAWQAISLPVSVVGQEYTFVRIASFAIRLTPRAGEYIRGGGAGKYLSLDADGTCVTIRCCVAGYWEIVNKNGTTSFEA